MLITHSNMTDEIQIKIGGDHGGKSFKACFEVCNTEKPNSTDNTIIFSLFEAKDHRSNLRTGLSRFTSQVDELQKLKWG